MLSCPGLSVCFPRRRCININLAVLVPSEGKSGLFYWKSWGFGAQRPSASSQLALHPLRSKAPCFHGLSPLCPSFPLEHKNLEKSGVVIKLYYQIFFLP